MGKSIEQQTEQTIDNISAILEADGASLDDVVKVTVHLSDTRLFASYKTVYAAFYTALSSAHHGRQRSWPRTWHSERPSTASSD